MKAKSTKPIMLGFPHNGTVVYGAAQGLFRASERRASVIMPSANSALALNFNVIWATALQAQENGQIDYLAFLHADIKPQDLWLDALADELEATGADFVSVPNAIKDNRGLTSTGIADPQERWHPFRRFTVRELLELPETFDAESAGYPGMILLHNTGLWIADLRNPEFHETDENGCLKFHFTLRDRIRKTADGYAPEMEPEDWFFSRRLHAAGLKTCVTRKVKTAHVGPMDFENHTAWGSYGQGDLDNRTRWGAVPIDDESGYSPGVYEENLCLTQ